VHMSLPRVIAGAQAFENGRAHDVWSCAGGGRWRCLTVCRHRQWVANLYTRLSVSHGCYC